MEPTIQGYGGQGGDVLTHAHNAAGLPVTGFEILVVLALGIAALALGLVLRKLTSEA